MHQCFYKSVAIKFLFALFFLPLQNFAQDITGTWAGFLQINDTRVPYELVISGDKKNLNGYSLITFTFDGVENVGVKTMEIKIKRASIAIEDGELIYDNYTTPSRRVKLYGTLVWVGRDSSMTLAGTLATRSLDMRSPNENNFKGTIKLQRKPPARSKLISKLDEMGLADQLSFVKPAANKDVKPAVNKEVVLAPVKEKEVVVKSSTETVKRETEVIRTVLFKSDSLVLSLYDNGEIDGDTVSLVLNGNIILSRQGLTDKAIRKTIATSEIGDSSKLVLYAENLGRIPPNSGLLILQDGNERYQIRFSGDLQKNAAVILRRRR
ncbi:MAG TPA: hypothetical protein VFD24_03015 [Chitinophagaceae bacterium]|nr:hypothetical protein [Chitinophagaceae bacterium]